MAAFASRLRPGTCSRRGPRAIIKWWGLRRRMFRDYGCWPMGIRMDTEQSGSSGWQVLWPRSYSTHPHVRLLTSQLFAEVCCFGLAGMCASMVGSCGLLARREKHRKVSPLHRFYYSHASCLAMSFSSHRCVHDNSDSAMPDTISLNKDPFGGLFYHLFPGAKSPTGSALLQSSLEDLRHYLAASVGIHMLPCLQCY